MKISEYEKWANRATKWAVGYFESLRSRPVRSQTEPGEIFAQLPESPPEDACDMEEIFKDFETIVPDGITHWQHPRFFAYFPANAAPASMIAENLVNAIAAQAMLWQTSPAATEIEQRMIDWMRQGLGLPEGFTGVIQDSATSATLSAVLTMRERAVGWEGIQDGLSGGPRLRVYASAQTHSSVDKAVRLAGIGQNNLVKIPTNTLYQMDASALRDAIRSDIDAGYKPAGIVICIGGTSIGASDNADAVIEVAKEFDLYTHVDAAWAGSAMICPELRPIWAGVEEADSIVFNPHKWLGAQFDCSIQFLADAAPQIRTLGLRPTYLETQGQEEIVNFNEWTIPLGRRFRALKLWFLVRAYGLEGLRTRIRNHIAWANEACECIRALPDFEITTEPQFSLFTFRFAPVGQDADKNTAELLERINNDGRTYLTQTLHEGQFVIRLQVGQFDTTREDVMTAVDVIEEIANTLRE